MKLFINQSHSHFVCSMLILFLFTIQLGFSEESRQKVDPSTLTGKVMCGYQGWFTAEGDGSGRGWFHYGKHGEFKPGQCSIDYWPDMREMDEDEKYPTDFKHKDGSTAYVFSSMHQKTVLRHFKWMRDFGIDGVFVQRFAVQTFGEKARNHTDTVLGHCRKGANLYGRAYALMYDLSGLGANQIARVINDYKRLVDEMKLTRDEDDQSYLHHNGKPVVAVWGIGFNDNRKYTLQDCAALIDFLKNDPQYGGNTVMVGVPTFWRTLERDAMPDPFLHEVILKADIISPWTIGRYRNPNEAERYAQQTMKADMRWCEEHDKEFLPVVFPGFSWHNLKPESPLNQIPRRDGEFLWKQFVEAKKAGAGMIYQAMFDEMDEGTAIFKCTNNPPVGESPFLTYHGLPTDHYLWLVGQGKKMLEDEIPVSEEIPARETMVR